MKTTPFLQLNRAEARVQAVLLALVAWSILAFSLTGPGERSRFGPLKWADFAHFYTLGHIARFGPADALYDSVAQHAVQVSLIPESAGDSFRIAYPPLTAFFFAPFSRLPYVAAGALWAAISIALLLGIVTIIGRRSRLRTDWPLVYAVVLAFPPTWELVGYGQTTIVPILAFALAWIALDLKRPLLAGVALGALSVKPQFGIVVAVVALACSEWRLIAGACISVAVQVLLSAILFGWGVVASYAGTVLTVATTAMDVEASPHMQHSLRVLFGLLPGYVGLVLLVLTSAAVVVAVVRIWRTSADSRTRMGTLVLASVLVNPHLYVYDASLLILAGLWLGEAFSADSHWFWRRAYLLTLLVLVPTAALVRIQLSVVAMLELFYQAQRRVS